MRLPKPLFITGTARGGTTLICRMLDAHEGISVAADPFFPLFRSFRNASLSSCTDAGVTAAFDPTHPLQDYYFLKHRIQMMDCIQNSQLDIPFRFDEWPQLNQAVLNRVQIESPELAPRIKDLMGVTYKALFDNALNIISEARNAGTCAWVGCKEVWTIEFMRPLACGYPDARFVVIMRDPRAVIASLHALAEKDPTQAAHTLSYLRHWRKYVAFILHYRRDPLFKDRLYVLKYEDLLHEPAREAENLCGFLEVPFEPGILDPRNYLDFVTGKPWRGNSSFDRRLSQISPLPADRWRTKLNPLVIKLVECICGADMRLLGYEPVELNLDLWSEPRILNYVIQENIDDFSWRSDLGDPLQDLGFELFRQFLLMQPRSQDHIDVDLIRRSFLFIEAYDTLRLETPDSGDWKVCKNHKLIGGRD